VPNWKKIIISGSNAELNSLNVTTNITASFFTGSFVGDGSGLTGVGGDPFPYTGSAEITGSLVVTGSLDVYEGLTSLYRSGSTVFNIEGSQGTLFTVTDELSGSLFSVNDISGIPIFEVFSDNTLKMGTFNSEELVITGSHTILSKVSQSFNFEDDTTAAEGGVPLGGLYHNDGAVRIRLQ
jgi:hypothetical protein